MCGAASSPRVRRRASSSSYLGKAGRTTLTLQKKGAKYGTIRYLAQWQGLRGEDLNIELDADVVITCAARGREVTFRPLGADLG